MPVTIQDDLKHVQSSLYDGLQGLLYKKYPAFKTKLKCWSPTISPFMIPVIKISGRSCKVESEKISLSFYNSVKSAMNVIIDKYPLFLPSQQLFTHAEYNKTSKPSDEMPTRLASKLGARWGFPITFSFPSLSRLLKLDSTVAHNRQINGKCHPHGVPRERHRKGKIDTRVSSKNSLRSYRFRLVLEQTKTKEWDFHFWLHKK